MVLLHNPEWLSPQGLLTLCRNTNKCMFLTVAAPPLRNPPMVRKMYLILLYAYSRYGEKSYGDSADNSIQPQRYLKDK